MHTLFELSQKLTIALGTQLPNEVREKFLKDSLQSIIAEKDGLKTNIVFAVNAFNVILASIVSAPALTLTFLQQNNAIELFLDAWLTFYIPHYTRTFDIKLSVMALLNIITQLSETEFASLSIANILPKLGSDLVGLIGKYPEAERELQEKRKEYTSFGSDFINSGADDAAWDEEGDDEVAEDEDDAVVQKFLEELKKEGGSGFNNTFDFNGGDSFDDLEEDPLTKSVLDDINVYTLVKASLSHLQQADVTRYQVALGQLTPEQQECLVNAMHN